jgi:hypothetical protein
VSRAAGALALALGGFTLASGGAARGDEPQGPVLEIFVIQATRTDAAGSVDPELKDLPTRQQPFDRFNVYKLVDHQRFSIGSGKPVAYSLVNGRTLDVSLGGVTRSDAGESRYQLATQIGQRGKDAFLKGLQVTASANQPFYVGGQSFQGGTLFVELVVRP